MSTYDPPLTTPQARHAHARQLATDHRPGPRRWWQRRSRCTDPTCRRPWPCHPAQWADAELYRIWWR